MNLLIWIEIPPALVDHTPSLLILDEKARMEADALGMRISSRKIGKMEVGPNMLVCWDLYPRD